ncbi:MAG: protein-L-isoaspartate(D-aspartate) O-methyltransferase [Proteobacteria bacterium]|nr:protein-L-isoaspartate(D-aspartate) O-methyltransferase [Pseudomonadota bacterium]
MVEWQLARRGVADPRVLAAMRAVPREAFVPAWLADAAYDDRPLPIDAGQTISQPYIVALMCEALRLEGGETVLEIGTGSGYAAAVLARIAAQVHSIERLPALAASARQRLHELVVANVQVHEGDGTLGWPAAAPYEAIVVTAGGPRVPPALLEQLAIGGRLVIPVGPEPDLQDLLRVTRTERDRHAREVLCGVRFVPLVGAQGWDRG